MNDVGDLCDSETCSLSMAHIDLTMIQNSDHDLNQNSNSSSPKNHKMSNSTDCSVLTDNHQHQDEFIQDYMVENNQNHIKMTDDIQTQQTSSKI